MQTVSTALQAIMDSGVNTNSDKPTRDWTTVYEFYTYDYIPSPTNGFEPANAVKRFAHINLTWNGLAYQRYAEGARSDTSRFMGKSFNSASCKFSNVDRTMAQWILSTDVEGMRLVIREISRSVTDSSVVLFVGRVDKPVEFDRITASFSAKQDLGAIEVEVPSRAFSPDDPDGRLPTDPLFRGFRIVALHGSFDRTRTEVRRKFLIFRKTVTTHYSEGWSSRDATPMGDPVPECFGRVQMELVPIAFADIGGAAKGLWVASNGKISAIENIRNPEDPNRQPNNVTVHLGDLGGTGTNAQIVGQPTNTGDQQFPGAGYFSETAYIGAGIPNGDTETVEDIVTVIAVILGRVVPLPDSSGSFTQEGWTDSGPYITRFLLTDEEFGMLNEAFIADSACVETAEYCAEPISDTANSERVFVSNTDLPQAGAAFHILRSTGRIDARRILFYDFDTGTVPELLDTDYEGFDETEIPGSFTLIPILQGRYTTNFNITEKVKLIDLLYDTVLRSYRGYLVVNSKGQIEPRSEKPGDHALLRAASIVGATSISVDDVDQWKANLLLRGKVLVGANLPSGVTTSEVRKITSALYSTAGNSIPLATSVTGTITATRSGATLSGGSTTVAASGTVTIGGSPAPADSVTVTIGGIPIQHVLEPYDTTGTVARMLMYRINANLRLKRYIKAYWDSTSPNVVTIKSKLGTLNLDQALVYAHTGPTADPSVAPILTPGSGGSLPAGTLYAAYSYETAIGETYVSPVQSVVVTANQKIITGVITPPAGSTVNWYLSISAGNTELAYVANNNGSALDITSLPDSDAPRIPLFNSTGEECLRVMMSFSDAGKNGDGSVSAKLKQAGLTRNNITKNSFKWPLGGKQSSINQAIIEYVDASNDFAKTTLTVNDKAKQTKVGKPTPIKISGAAIDNYNQAFRIANGALAKNSEGNWFGSLTTADPNAMLLEEGDLFCASDESGGFVNIVLRVEEASVHADRSTTITGRLYSTQMFSDYVRARTISLPTTLKYVQTLYTQMLVMDLPTWREQDASQETFFYVALARGIGLGDWRDAKLWADFTGEYKQITEASSLQATIGDALTTLANTSNVYTFDNVSTVRVQLTTPGATLSNATESEVLAGKNKCALGNNDNGWEIFGFTTQVLVGGTEDTYDLSGLLRGRHGTENYTGIHSLDDKFCLLDENVQTIPIDLAFLNREFHLKAQTRNEDLSDSTTQAAVWTGRSRKPLSIDRDSVKSTRDSEGDLLGEFLGRARVGGGLRSNQGGAINEEREEYRAQPVGTSRVMKIIPGVPMAALLESNASSGKFGGVTHNALEIFTGAPLGTLLKARSYQRIDATGNKISAILSNNVDGAATIALVEPSADWKNTQWTTRPLAVQLSGGHLSSRRLAFIENGSVISSLTDGDDAERPVGNGVLVEITFYGTEIRVAAYLPGVAQPVTYRASFAPTFPYHAYVEVQEEGSIVKQVRMSTAPFPKFIYASDQQRYDFGLNLSDPLPAAIDFDLWEWSPVIGDGEKLRVTL